MLETLPVRVSPGWSSAEQPILLARSALLKRRPLGQDQPVPPAVHLDDLEEQRAPLHRLETRLDRLVRAATPQIGDLRQRHEPAHALDVDDEPALVVLDDLALDGLPVLVALLEVAPAALGAGARQREDDTALLILTREHVREHRLADARHLGLRHLSEGDHGLGLRTDVHEELVAVGTDHDALDDFASPPLPNRLLVFGEPIAHPAWWQTGRRSVSLVLGFLARRGLFHTRCFPPLLHLNRASIRHYRHKRQRHEGRMHSVTGRCAPRALVR